MNDGPSLAGSVAAALGALVDFAALPPSVSDGRVEQALREALAAHQRRHGSRARGNDVTSGSPETAAAPDASDLAAAAVGTACAHLATRSVEDAYLALRTASDHLGLHRRATH